MRTDAGPVGQRPQPDRPERIAVTAAGDAAAFVVVAGQAGPTAASGIWYGPLAGQPARISDLIPSTNLAFAPNDRALAAAVQDETDSTMIVLDPALEPVAWRQFRLPGFAEAWPGPWTAWWCWPRSRARTRRRSLGPPASGQGDDRWSPEAAGWRRLWRVDAETGTAQLASRTTWPSGVRRHPRRRCRRGGQRRPERGRVVLLALARARCRGTAHAGAAGITVAAVLADGKPRRPVRCLRRGLGQRPGAARR